MVVSKPADQQQGQVVEQFGPAEHPRRAVPGAVCGFRPGAVRIGDRDQHADEVVTRVGAPLRRQRKEVLVQPDGGLVRRLQHREVHADLNGRGQVPGQRPEPGPVRLGDSQQLTNYGDREQEREIMHELHRRTARSPFGHKVKQLIGHSRDRGAETGHPALCERTRHGSADSGMIGRIGVQDRVHAQRGMVPPARVHLVEACRVRDPERGIAQYSVDGVVAVRDDSVGDRHRGLPQPVQRRVQRIWIRSSVCC